MLKPFIKGSIGQVVVIALVATMLWVRAFLMPVQMLIEPTFSPLYEHLYQWLSATPRLASALALLLVLAQGIWLNIILSNHKITNSNSLLPLLLYMVAMCWDSSSLTITPSLLANIMLIGACSMLLSSGSTSLNVDKLFNASFLLGLAVLCHLPTIYYMLPMVFIFITYKLYSWRYVFAGILGLIAPFIIVVIYAFLTDKLHYYQILVMHDLSTLHHIVAFSNTLASYTNIVFLLLLVMSLLWQLTNPGDRMNHQRINARVLTLPLLASVCMMFYGQIFPINTQTVTIPFTFLMTLFLFVRRKRRWMSELLLWITVVGAVL